MTTHRTLTPNGWPRGKGYSHGVAAEGRMVFVSGQVGWDEQERMASGFVAQSKQALENTVAILEAGGALPEHIVRMTWFILDKQEYLANVRELGAVYRDIIGKNFPAMAVVEVRGLLEDGARLEIETTAVVPKQEE